MNIFICVYRHANPGKELQKVLLTSKTDPSLRKFLTEYKKPGNCYDWGDDPAFFKAKEVFNNYNCATWGVCRRDVRNNIKRGDLVIYFCGREENQLWHYYFIGFGTVAKALFRRMDIWKKARYEYYRLYFNILIDGNNQHCEPFGIDHPDWEKRISAPYIFFETDPRLTIFRPVEPLMVASCDPTKSLTETWNNSRKARALYQLLLVELQNSRTLRIQNIQRAHRHIRIQANLSTLDKVRQSLKDILEND